MKLLKNYISSPLSQIFNISFSSGVFPSILKTAKVILVHKTDSKLDFSNYLLISLLSNIEKIVERLMYNRIYKFFSAKNLIYSLQFDFRQKYSTVQLEKTWKKGLQKVYCRNDVLLWKHEDCGVRGLANESVKSFLSDRKWYVSIWNKIWCSSRVSSWSTVVSNLY